jgi:DNA repair exonuclease SbcCD nuclease subunit
MDAIDLGVLREGGAPPSFLHAADLHLGASEHVLEAFNHLVTTAESRRVDFVALSGDIYDAADRSANLQMRFLKGLRALSNAGIHVFIAHGNHDPLAADFRPVVGEMPPLVHVFEPGEPQTYVAQIAGRTVAVTGVSFKTKHDVDNLAERIARTRVAADLRVGVVHANVEGQPGHDPYAPCNEDHLRNSDIDYWALGHIHLRTEVQLSPGRWWVYPGNLQGRSTKPAECGPKGVVVVTADGGGFAAPEFVPCDVHRYLRVDVSADGLDLEQDVADAAVSALTDAFEEHGRRGLTVRVRLTGATAAHSGLSKLTSDEIAAFLENPLVEVDRVENATRRPVDRAALAKSEGLVGVLLRRMDAMRSDPGSQDLDAVLRNTADAAGAKALGRVLEMARRSEIDSNQLLAVVEQLIIDELEGADQ